MNYCLRHISLLLLLSGEIVMAQSVFTNVDFLLPESQPSYWWKVSTSHEAEWQHNDHWIDNQGIAQFYLVNKYAYKEDLSVLTLSFSEISHLGQPFYVDIDISCQLSLDQGRLTISYLNDDQWVNVRRLSSSFNGKIKFPIDDPVSGNVQIKFVYQSSASKDEAIYIFDAAIKSGSLSNTQMVENPFEVYPNPFTDKVSLNFVPEESSSTTSLNIRDVQGRLVFSKLMAIDPMRTTMDLNMKNIASGVYWMEIRSENQVWHQKVIKR